MKKAEIYKGHVITFTCGFYWTLGTKYITIKKAKEEIDLL